MRISLAKKRATQVGVVASRLALDIEKSDPKCVSFLEYLKKVSQKFQDPGVQHEGVSKNSR